MSHRLSGIISKMEALEPICRRLLLYSLDRVLIWRANPRLVWAGGSYHCHCLLFSSDYGKAQS